MFGKSWKTERRADHRREADHFCHEDVLASGAIEIRLTGDFERLD